MTTNRTLQRILIGIVSAMWGLLVILGMTAYNRLSAAAELTSQHEAKITLILSGQDRIEKKVDMLLQQRPTVSQKVADKQS